jgi:hypothetical protein
MTRCRRPAPFQEHQREADKEFRWLENHISTRFLNIRTFGISGRTGQAKMAAKILGSGCRGDTVWMKRQPSSSSLTKPVVPVLNAIPAEIRNINITMGLPLRQTMAWSFSIPGFVLYPLPRGATSQAQTPIPPNGPGYRMRHILRLLTLPWMGFLLSIDKSDKAQHALAIPSISKVGVCFIPATDAFLTERVLILLLRSAVSASGSQSNRSPGACPATYTTAP